MQSSLHDIVQGLTVARTHASLMAEQWPHHARTLTAFDAELLGLQRRLVAQLRMEGLYDENHLRVKVSRQLLGSWCA